MTNKEKQLNELIPAYFTNKEKMEKYKKVADAQNKDIKSLMDDDEVYEFEKYKATTYVSTKVEFDEQKLLNILKANNIDAIRTKEYVDMDELENMIYHNDIPKNVLKQISACKSEKQTKNLRVTCKK